MINRPGKLESPGGKSREELAGERQAARRRMVLDAAMDCFLTYGLTRTSLDDIARKAGISRPLLYLLFRNKEELFIETLRATYEASMERARPVLARRCGGREKLFRIYDEMMVTTWTRIHRSPHGAEFMEGVRRFFPQLEEEYEEKALRLLEPVIGDREVAIVFMLCVDGLYSDHPTPEVFRRRLRLLVDRFLPADEPEAADNWDRQ